MKKQQANGTHIQVYKPLHTSRALYMRKARKSCIGGPALSIFRQDEKGDCV